MTDGGSLIPCESDRRFVEWTEAVFLELWRRGLLVYDEFVGIDWSSLAMDEAITKVPLGREKPGPNPTDRAERGAKRSLLTEVSCVPVGVAADGANSNDAKLARETIESISVEQPHPSRSKPQDMGLNIGHDVSQLGGP